MEQGSEGVYAMSNSFEQEYVNFPLEMRQQNYYGGGYGQQGHYGGGMGYHGYHGGMGYPHHYGGGYGHQMHYHPGYHWGSHGYGGGYGFPHQGWHGQQWGQGWYPGQYGSGGGFTTRNRDPYFYEEFEVAPEFSNPYFQY